MAGSIMHNGTIHRQSTGQGILLISLSLFFFAGMDATAKLLLEYYPTLQVIWVRFLGQFLAAVLFLRAAALTHIRATSHPGLHVIRAFMQLGAIGFFFLALRHIGLAEATAIFDVSPVLITLGAALFLRERLGPRRVFGVCIALIGAMIIIRPGAASFSPWALLPFAGALCYATNALITRRVGQRESVWTAVLISSLICSILTSIFLPLVWQPVQTAHLWLFVLIAALGTVGQLCMIRAFSVAEASSVAPFAYLGTVFATGFGIVMFNEWPDRWTLAGALVIIAAGLYVWHREIRSKADRAPL